MSSRNRFTARPIHSFSQLYKFCSTKETNRPTDLRSVVLYYIINNENLCLEEIRVLEEIKDMTRTKLIIL